MLLAVFGATGKTGRLIVGEALAAGHSVRALARDPAKLAISHPNLTKVHGHVEDPVAVRETIAGLDAVISALSSGRGTLSAFTAHAVPAMKAVGVNRIVSLIGAATAQPGDKGSPGRFVMITLMKLVAADVLRDARHHAEALQATNLEWTLVRPPRLTDGPKTGKIVHGLQLELGPRQTISRADLAAFMLETATSGLYVRQAPLVTSA